MSTLPSPSKYEFENVHTVYEQIAHHFSSTRYKPWPRISTFLTSLPAGSIGVDAGCGNGKNLSVNPAVYILGSDRSLALTQIAGAANRPSDVIVADILSFPHPPHAFDFAICIAVIHHLSTTPRRVDAIRSVLAVLKPGGTALFYVWALEQASSRRGWDEGGEQDVMVPWVSKAKREEGGEQVFQRYYHLYRKGELEENVASAGGEVVESGYEKDNWWAIARPNMVSNEQEQT